MSETLIAFFKGLVAITELSLGVYTRIIRGVDSYPTKAWVRSHCQCENVVDKYHAEVFIPFWDSDDPDVAASEVLEMSAGKNHCYDNASIPIVTEA